MQIGLGGWEKIEYSWRLTTRVECVRQEGKEGGKAWIAMRRRTEIQRGPKANESQKTKR